MMVRRLILLTTILSGIFASENGFALGNNTFSGALFLGDSYAPNNFRLSYKSFDLGYSDQLELYAGSRLWHESYYAGFGLGSALSFYGMVGYEWRFVSWMGLSAEFNGCMDVRGTAAARVYLGLVVGW